MQMQPNKSNYENIFEIHYIRKHFSLPCNKNCLAWQECQHLKLKEQLDEDYKHYTPKTLHTKNKGRN